MNTIRNQSLPRGFVLLLLFLAASLSAWAQTEEPCFNQKALKNICLVIESRSLDPNPQGNYIYNYQRKLMDAACVDISKDSKEVIARKIQRMWLQFEEQLICNSVKFDQVDGNIINFAVNMKFDDFIWNVTRWGVNMNRVHPFYGTTVLDYVQKEIERNEGHSIAGRLKKYHDWIRAAGGKYASEL